MRSYFVLSCAVFNALLFFCCLFYLMTTMRVNAQTWVVVKNDNFSGRTTPTTAGAAGSTGGVAGDGRWIDVQGGVWSINTASQLQAVADGVDGNTWKRDALVRPAGENTQNQRIAVTIGANQATNPVVNWWAILRYQSPGNYYMCGYRPDNGQMTIYKVVGGTATLLTSGTLTYTQGHDYIQDFSAVTNGGSTSLNYTLTDTTTNNTITLSSTDTTATLQAGGQVGLAGGAANAPTVTRQVVTYSDSAQQPPLLAVTYPLATPLSTGNSISPAWSWTGGTGPFIVTVYRSTTANFTPGGGSQIAQTGGIPATSYTYTDTNGLTVGTPYYYKATITDSLGASATASFHVAGSLTASTYVLGLIGDSIMAGANIDTTVSNGNNIITSVGSANSPTRNPGVALAAALQTMGGFRSVTYVSSSVAASGQSNQAVSGKTTADWWNGGNGLLITATANWNAMSVRPNLFCIMLGTNDVRSDKRGNIAIPGAIGSAGSYADNLQKIVNYLLTTYPGCLVFLHYPPYCTPNGTSTSSGTTILFDETSVALLQTSVRSAINSVVASFATSNPGQVYVGDAGVAFNYFAERYNAAGSPEYCQEQYGGGQIFFLHPNATGAANLGRIWANGIYNALFAPTKGGTRRRAQ